VIPSENKPTKLTLCKRVKEYSLANAVPLSLILAIVGTVIGLGGFAFGVWSHFASQHNPLLKYGVYPVRGRIVRSENLSDLKVLYKGAEVPGDISVAYVVFQNIGTAAIENTDILTPIDIQLDGKAPILEASIQKNEQTRSLTKVSLDQSQASSGQLGVGWKILEQNDGFVVQITYAGSVNTGIKVTGDVKGQRQGIEQVTYPPGSATTTKEYDRFVSLHLAEFVLIFIGLLAFVMEITLYLYLYSRKIKQEIGSDKLRIIRKQVAFYPIFLMVMSVTGVIVGILLWVGTE